MGAALTWSAVAVALSLTVAGPTAAAPAKLPSQLWGIQVPSASPAVTVAYLRAAGATGVNALVVDGDTSAPAKLQRLGVAARAGGVRMLVAYSPHRTCPPLPPPALCATKAGSVSTALEAASPRARPVVLSISRLAQLTALARARGRVVAVVPYRLTSDQRAWGAAIARAKRSAMLDLAVAPPSARMAPPGRAFPRPAEIQPAPPHTPPTGQLPPPPAPGPAPVDPTPGPAPSAPPSPSPSPAPTPSPEPIDTTPPVAVILSGPPALAGDGAALIVFTANELSTFACKLDGPSGAGAAAPCSSPLSLSGLSDGTYLLSIVATDAAGNVEPTPVTYGWTVDTLPPDTTLTSTPAATSGANVSFAFASTEGGSTFRCDLDHGGFVACSAPQSYTGLSVGSHTFSVEAVDRLGRVDATPATFTWTVRSTVPANLFMSPTGNDANTCNSPATPCRTFNGAFQKAKSGDVVELAAGTYSAGSAIPAPLFVVANHPAITSAVTFRPAAGATVLLASDLDIEASHVHVTGLRSRGTGDPANGPDNSRVSLSVCETPCATPLTDVYVEGFAGKSAFIRSSGVTIKGGEFGNYDPCADDPQVDPSAQLHQNPEDIFRIWGATGAASTPNNVLVDGVRIHDDDDHRDSSGACPGATNGSAGEHVDCLQAQGGTNITIQNVSMWNCATSNIQATPFGGTMMSNWTIQNNFFGSVLHPGNSTVLGGEDTTPSDCTSIVLRYNVIAGPQPNGSGCAAANIGNISAIANVFLGPTSALGANVMYSHNVFSSATTVTLANLNGGGNHANVKCNPSFVAPNASGANGPDYHLNAGDICAKGAGDPANFPATDIDGTARPAGGVTPDAGADEIP